MAERASLQPAAQEEPEEESVRQEEPPEEPAGQEGPAAVSGTRVNLKARPLAELSSRPLEFPVAQSGVRTPRKISRRLFRHRIHTSADP